MDNDLDAGFLQVWEKYGQYVLVFGRKLVITLLIIAGGKIILSLSQQLIQRAVKGKIHFDETLASVLRMVVQYGVVIICLIMILDLFGANTAGLIALLGAAGVAVGFSLKDTLGNIASGIIILFLRPFKKGDYIECESTAGTVVEMGLFATTLKTPDGIFISAPNSSLWGVPLKNYSHNPTRRLDIAITISYNDSIDTAFGVLSEIIKSESRFLDDPPSQVMVQSLGESGTGVTLRAWVLGDNYWSVYWDQMKIVKEKIQAAGLTIALPRREIHLTHDKQETP
jgi:small conductance mechanosensitive channel